MENTVSCHSGKDHKGNRRLYVRKGEVRYTVGPVDSGDADSVHVFFDGPWIVVLNVNYGLPYVGIEVYSTDGDGTAERIGVAFFQEGAVHDAFGPDWEGMDVGKLAEAALEYAQ